MTRGSLWDELEEPLDELEPEGGFELGELLGEPDFELEEPDAVWELEELDVLDFEVDELDDELDEPDLPDADELEEDAGLAGVPSFAAMSNGPVTPGPKYFAVRS